jgi:hypothetical protein
MQTAALNNDDWTTNSTLSDEEMAASVLVNQSQEHIVCRRLGVVFLIF